MRRRNFIEAMIGASLVPVLFCGEKVNAKPKKMDIPWDMIVVDKGWAACVESVRLLLEKITGAGVDVAFHRHPQFEVAFYNRDSLVFPALARMYNNERGLQKDVIKNHILDDLQIVSDDLVLITRMNESVNKYNLERK